VVIAYDDGDEETASYPDKDGGIELMSASVRLKQKVAYATKRERSTNEETAVPETASSMWNELPARKAAFKMQRVWWQPDL
jgi:hypothetical protein